MPKQTKKTDVNTKANQTATLRALNKTATAINRAFDQAAKFQGQADDKRLIAAVKLFEAKQECEAKKIKFKTWAEENVKQAWNTVRLLIPVGEAEAGKEGAGLAKLTEMRERNKQANQRHRATKKATVSETPTPSASKPAPESAVAAVRRMDKSQRECFLRSEANEQGMQLITNDELKALKHKDNVSPAERAMNAFTALDAKAQQTFLKWATKHAKDPNADEDLLEIPDKLKRTKKAA